MIDVPKKLNDEQEKAVEELSKTLGSSDPRAGLFANGAGPRPGRVRRAGRASES